MAERTRWKWSLPAALLGVGLFDVACRESERLSRLLLQRLSRPMLALLHRATAGLPFPLAEPLALLLTVTAVIPPLLAALRRDVRALRRQLRHRLWAAALLAGSLALLWAPARAVPPEPVPPPDAAGLAKLCEALIDGLNRTPLDFPEPAEALRLAPSVAGMPGAVVKAARYPEWMRALDCAGLFMPLTGEVVADAGAAPALVPFTAVHELAHLAGVADEGAANIAAWRRCLKAGGAFADSARLWALRYALGLLREADPAAWRDARTKMEGPLARTFHEINGETVSATPRFSPAVGDYAALAGYLVATAPGL